MAVKKVVTDQNIGKGLAVEAGKLNVNIDTGSMEFDMNGKLKAKMPAATAPADLQGDELQDLGGTRLGFLVKNE